jgi:hypothetical protein
MDEEISPAQQMMEEEAPTKKGGKKKVTKKPKRAPPQRDPNKPRTPPVRVHEKAGIHVNVGKVKKAMRTLWKDRVGILAAIEAAAAMEVLAAELYDAARKYYKEHAKPPKEGEDEGEPPRRRITPHLITIIAEDAKGLKRLLMETNAILVGGGVPPLAARQFDREKELRKIMKNMEQEGRERVKTVKAKHKEMEGELESDEDEEEVEEEDESQYDKEEAEEEGSSAEEEEEKEEKKKPAKKQKKKKSPAPPKKKKKDEEKPKKKKKAEKVKPEKKKEKKKGGKKRKAAESEEEEVPLKKKGKSSK